MEKSALKTALVYDERMLEHQTGAHPETPDRLIRIRQKLKEKGVWSRLLPLEVAPAPLQWLEKVHAPDYVRRVEQACLQNLPFLDSADTPISAASYPAARLAAGGVLAAVDAVMAGRAANAFCAVRPPGHHAGRDRAMGFCLFNNVAVGAQYARARYGLGKVLIVDWDVHHGNGTQDAFYADGQVFFFSIHQWPFYPGTGAEVETGAGAGRGFTLNAPLAPGSGDREYGEVFKNKLSGRALAFKPDIIFISAGFDAYRKDPLGQMQVSPAGFAALTAIVKSIAAQTCGGRLVSVLEGGYNLDGLAECVLAHVSALMGDDEMPIENESHGS